MSEPVTYIQGSDLPDLTIEWRDRNGALIQFQSVAHTFDLKVGHPGQAADLTKSTGFTGADTAPNVTVQWATTGELNTLTPGTYQADLTATRSGDGKQRKLRFPLVVLPAIS
jgi:hypothetical protein